jgi:hypothetical protein
MKNLLRRIADAIRREPPELARLEQQPLVSDESMHELDRELDSGQVPERFEDQDD